MAKQRNEYTPSSCGRTFLLRLAGCFALGVIGIWYNPFVSAAYESTTTQDVNTQADRTNTTNMPQANAYLVLPTQSATGTTGGVSPQAGPFLVVPPAQPVTQTVAPPAATPPLSQEFATAVKDFATVQAALKSDKPENMPVNPAVPRAATAAAPVNQILPNEVSTSAAVVMVPTAPLPPGIIGGGNPSTFGTAKDPVFQNMTKKMYPMSPEQIKALRDVDLMTQRAIAGATPVDAPTPTLSSQTVSLAPGSVPPVIRLSTGYVSSVVFVDETGAPWPVGAYSIGDPTSFNIQWDTKSNLLLIQGQKPYATGNMAVRLQDMPTPVMLTLVTDQNNVDYRIDFRVQGRGPHALASIIGSSLPQNADAILMNLLEGIPPQGSQPLHIVGGPAQGWLQGNTLYLRTSLTILSPAWIKTMTSADGTKVYQFSATPMILASQGGQPLTLRIEGL